MSLNEHRPASWNSRIYGAHFVIAAAAIVFAGLAIAGTLGVAPAVAGIGLITASVGCGALLLLALNGAVKMLGSYARLHYRLLKPEQHPA